MLRWDQTILLPSFGMASQIPCVITSMELRLILEVAFLNKPTRQKEDITQVNTSHKTPRSDQFTIVHLQLHLSLVGVSAKALVELKRPVGCWWPNVTICVLIANPYNAWQTTYCNQYDTLLIYYM